MIQLASLRVERGYTQEQMANMLGIGISTYNQYEKSNRSIPANIATKISEILKIDKEKIFLPTKFTVSKQKER